MQVSDNILQAIDLSVGYKDKVVRAGINVSLAGGKLVCLMGPNGSGKSTLLRTLAGVQSPLTGKVQIGGNSLVNMNLREKAKHISLVLTETAGANLTVLEMVSLGRHPYTDWSGRLGEQDKQVITQALEAVGIMDLADRKLYKLSDGQRQKAMIARALSQDGKLLILDEPTAHLDLINRVQIMHLLLRLAKYFNKAIIVATHELDLALQTADELWLLQAQAGDIVRGLPEDLMLSGHVQQTFHHPLFTLNSATGAIEYPVKTKKEIKLQGEGLTRHWTERALKRNGYLPVEEKEGIATVLVKQGKDRVEWILIEGEKTRTFLTLNKLIEQLDKEKETSSS